METLKVIETRASVREYQRTEPVPKKILEKLVDAGRRAPTARGVEPWEFIVVMAPATLLKLGKMIENGKFILAANACVVIFCRDTKYYLEDGCAATENILLAAADLGLGACWVAGDKKDYAEDVRALLKVPEGYKLISLIPLGWPKTGSAQKKNRGLQDVIHWETF